MLQEVDSNGLVEQEAQLHSILFCGFRASAHSLVNSGIQANAAAGSPMQAACSLLQYLLGPAAGNASLRTKTLARHAELQGFLQDDVVAKVLLLETKARQVQQVMQQIHQAQNLLQGAKGAFLVAFPRQDLAKETKLHRLLEHSCRIETYPGRLSLGSRSDWVPQDSKVSMVPLFKLLQLGIAMELALDRVASSWHVAVTSKQERFCFTAALLDSLPSTLHTLYEPELNLLTDRHHKQLLRDGSPTIRTSMQASLPHLQMCDEDVARLRLDPDLALRCDAGRCTSQAATAWSLADEAIGRCLPKAYTDFNALELMEGISLAASIVSVCFTYTPAHVEDMLQGAVNDLVAGAWKVWYVVDPAKAAVFKKLLQDKYGPDALQRVFEKQLRPTLSAAEMRHAGVRIIFQPPGFMMVTLPVRSSSTNSQVECSFPSDLLAMNLAKASPFLGNLGVSVPHQAEGIMPQITACF